jgi:hypothetical protein
MRILAWLLTALVLPQTTSEQELRATEQGRFEAMMRADTTALRRPLSPELVYTHSNGMVETRDQHLAAIGAKKTVYESLAPVAISYRFYGELAVGTGEVKSKGTLDGTAFDVRLRVSTVHQRRDGRWQLLLWQSTRLP